MRNYILALILTLSAAGCHESREQQREASAQAITAFATHFFNWRYVDALPLVAPESERWLRLLASNVSEEDVELLRNRDADAVVTLEHIDMADMTDTAAMATVVVTDYYVSDTLGRPAHLVDKGRYHFLMVRRDGKWTVKMEGLPRNGM